MTRIAAPIWQWGKYYALIVKTVLDRTYGARDLRPDQAVNYWFGMSSGVVDVILSKKLSYNSYKMIDVLRREIISGNLKPFEGELHRQDGRVMAEGGKGLTSREIITMDWLNDNVIGTIPPVQEISDSARMTMEVSGVNP